MTRILPVALLALPALASAEPVLGTPHQLIVSNDVGASAMYSWVPGAGSRTFWSFSPAADFFVREKLSVGLGLSVFGQSDNNDTAARTSTSARARVGWMHALNDLSGVWFRASLAASHESAQNGNPSASTVSLGLDAPVVFTPAAHLLLGVGPGFRLDLANWRDGHSIDGKLRAITLNVVLGGFL